MNKVYKEYADITKQLKKKIDGIEDIFRRNICCLAFYLKDPHNIKNMPGCPSKDNCQLQAVKDNAGLYQEVLTKIIKWKKHLTGKLFIFMK